MFMDHEEYLLFFEKRVKPLPFNPSPVIITIITKSTTTNSSHHNNDNILVTFLFQIFLRKRVIMRK